MFIQYGISEIIFPDKDKAYDDWKQKKEDFLRKRNGNFYIRSDKGERWSKAYNDIFEGLSVNIDKIKIANQHASLRLLLISPRKVPRIHVHISLVRRAILCYFLRCLTYAIFPIYMPLFQIQYVKNLLYMSILEKVKIEFGDIISEYNSFIRKHCIHKIEDYISKILKFDNLSRSDKRFIKDFRKQWEEIEV